MSDHPFDMPGRLMLARSVVGAMDDRGYCACPGKEQHSNKSGPLRPDRPGRDCRVYLSKSASNPRGVPTIKCVHSSCSTTVAEANHKLRSEIARHESKLATDAGYPFKPSRTRRRTPQQIAAQAEESRMKALAIRSRAAMPRILSTYQWSRPEMWEQSAKIPTDAVEQANCILRLFPSEDVVWVGGFVDSISSEDMEESARLRAILPAPDEPDWQSATSRLAEEKRMTVDELVRILRLKLRLPEVKAHFRLRDEWFASQAFADERRIGLRICPNSFKPGAHSRGIESVLHRRFLVIEHDSLPMEQQGAMLRWMSETMNLRAVIYTGGKSYHGWFECPSSENELVMLKTTLCGHLGNLGEGKRGYIGGMGYDAATFNASQPYPLPGCSHRKSGKPAELIYLQP